MKNLRGPKVAGFFLVTFLQAIPVFAQKSNCAAMAEMAKDVANLRDAGVPKELVQKRLKRDVPNQEELALAILVLKLVYSTKGTGEDLKTEVLKKCDERVDWGRILQSHKSPANMQPSEEWPTP